MSAGPPYDCHERGETRTRWHERHDGLEECVQFSPGFVCRDHSMKGHGNHGMEIRWYLRGPAGGGAHFILYTDWLPGRPANSEIAHLYPMGADVGYHSHRPKFDGDTPMSEECSITGGICYYDGSGLRARDLTFYFKERGEQVIWNELEAIYRSLITEAKPE